MQQVPSQENFKEIIKSYQKLYNTNLLKDVSGELQSSEYNEMISIIASKPDKYKPGKAPVYNYKAWAKRLKAAFDKSYGFVPGTDEDAIRAVFVEIPSRAAFGEVAKAYRGRICH